MQAVAATNSVPIAMTRIRNPILASNDWGYTRTGVRGLGSRRTGVIRGDCADRDIKKSNPGVGQ